MANEEGILGLDKTPKVIYDQFGLPIYIPTGDEEPLLTPAQTAYLAGQFPPGAATVDAAGKMAEMPSREVTMEQLPQHMLSGERAPSLAENLSRGGFGGYGSAALQGLGLAGDALYAAPVVGPVLGATVGTTLKGISNLGKVGKVVRAASKSDEGIAALKTDVDMFARDDSGFISPTIQALIEKAPANLKGQQITEWANANANKGVRPKELGFLGLDEFVAANPNATTREAVQGISGNRVRISQNVRSGKGEGVEFERTIPETDPLDGSSLWQHRVDDLYSELEQGDEFIKKDVLGHYNQKWLEENTPNAVRRANVPPGTVSGEGMTIIDDLQLSSFDDIPESAIDDLVEDFAQQEYMDSPYEMLRPQGRDGTTFGSRTFAFGNPEDGYQLFFNGERVTVGQIPYSRAEAEIQLQQALGIEDYGSGGAEFKQYVDQSLPGGENYREVVFNWDNAPETHTYGHFDDENQIAHALIRDRTLSDGTPSLHIDELQSDLHTKGSQLGYRTPPKQRGEVFRKLEDFLKDNETYELQYRNGDPGIVDTTYVIGEERVPHYPYNDDFFSFSDIKTISEISKQPGYLEQPIKRRNPFSQNMGEDLDEIVDIIQPILDEGPVPDYPFKDNWYEMVLKNLLLDAAREGKPALSVSGSLPIKNRYSEQYSNFYEMLYDRKVPSFMKKLANRYGGEFEQGRLDVDDTFPGWRAKFDDDGDELRQLDSNIIRITPEMRERILEEGIPSFGAGGIVDITQGTDPSMVDRVGNFMQGRM